LVQRLLAYAEHQLSPQVRDILIALSDFTGPVLWISVRTKNRTLTNQRQLLSALAYCFLKLEPKGAIVVDGFSVPADIASCAADLKAQMMQVVRQDRAVADAVRDQLLRVVPSASVYVAVGLSVCDSIFLARKASIYFCHHGTVQHKVGWFGPTPGLVHTNRAFSTPHTGEWIAQVSEVAVPPIYLDSALFDDVQTTVGIIAEFDHLLHQTNYFAKNVPAILYRFILHAIQTGVVGPVSAEVAKRLGEEAMLLFNSSSAGACHSGDTSGRHFLAIPEDPVPRGILYIDFFRFIDDLLQPRSYFEIGTEQGVSVGSFRCSAVCVDPQFRLNGVEIAARSEMHFYQMPSDLFFSKHDLRKIFDAGPDICFLDGMHRAEYLLRDFINTERACHRRSVIFIHDCLPANTRMALRKASVGDESEGEWRHAWTGDVWKILPVLKKYRPDLKMFILDCAPTGLVVVSNVDPSSGVLANSYGDIMDELRELDLKDYTIRRLWTDYSVISSQSLIQHPEDLTLFFDLY
jgi:hypothetical protein